MKRKSRKPSTGVEHEELNAMAARLQDFERKVEELTNDLTESLEQQAATSEILRVISSSPTDIQPVLDAVAESAARLCGAHDVVIRLVEGNVHRAVAHHGPIPIMATRAFSRGDIGGRAMLDARTVHISDVTEARVREEYPETHTIAAGQRTFLAVPLMREDTAIGMIVMRRMEVRPFTDKQINLLETFAAQAVIAIENVRLFKELQARNADLTEALEQQTATSEILRVISSSPTDIQPVLEAVASSAARLCEASDALILLKQGDVLCRTTHYGKISAWTLGDTIPITRVRVTARSVLEGRQLHIHDVQAESGEFPESSANARELGYRTMLATPLLREGTAIGVISIRRAEVRPFSDKQMALLQTFADQAVIAIQNVRLFKELHGRNAEITAALEQQTATSEVLRVISSSPTDLQPVFDAILENATRLCGAHLGGLGLYDGEKYEYVAQRGVKPEFLDRFFRGPFIPAEGTNLWRTITGKRPHHVSDLAHNQQVHSTNPVFLKLGARTVLGVPMVKEGRVVGSIIIYRTEVRPFTQEQIDLVSTFASQAVIAIENVRLFKELEARNRDLTESLEQRTATAEILRIIASSPSDIQPVLDAVAANAARLCNTDDAAIRLIDGDTHRPAAHYGAIPERPVRRLRRNSLVGRAVFDRRTVHVPDAWDEAMKREFSESNFGDNSFRTLLMVPLVRDDKGLGVIALRRTHVQPFTSEQIKLLETFADQAVIAIENVRLFKETKEALEQQTVISEILRVISRSPTDVQPVFDAIVKSGVHLFGGLTVSLRLFRGDHTELVASTFPILDSHGTNPLPADDDETPGSRAIVRREVVQLSDILAEEWVSAAMKQRARERRIRGIMCAPMLQDNAAIGSISVTRATTGLFTDKQVALLETFANQAVIAIENVRLFNELQSRNAEVTESLEQQTATAEILRVISSSPTDLRPVFDCILEHATRLCGAHLAALGMFDGEKFEFLAQRGCKPEFVERLFRGPFVPVEGTNLRRMLSGQRTLHILDRQAQPIEVRPTSVFANHGARTMLSVPMVKEGRTVGGIVIYRPEVRLFTQKQIDLVSTFAAQAVIAIENVRLFNEIQEKSRELEVANRHKSEFLAGMSHELRTPLNAILGFSEVLAERMFGDINEKQAEYLEDIRGSGTHLLSLINDILDLSKIEAGRMELELSMFDIAAALENALTLVRERATRHGIGLDLRCDSGVGPWTADERKFKQIMLNLLSNAVKFTPPGGRITVEARRDGDTLDIGVSDTGCGISAEDQALVFDEFRQVGGDSGKKAEGTGLGLALTRKFVELHGGSISVRSEPGQGATFSFTLPAPVG